MKLKTIGINEEAYDILNEYRTKGKSFSESMKALAESVCGKAEKKVILRIGYQ